MIVCSNGFMVLGKISVEGFPQTLLSFSNRVTDCGILFLFITLLKCQFQTLKVAKSKVNAAVNCWCCQMAAFPLQGQGEGYCFNLVLKVLFGYEIHLIPHTICHNSHLNWGSNNQPLFICRGMQLLPSFNERCQLHPNPLLLPSKELWCTPLIYNLIVCIWAISCLSNICNFSPSFGS